MNRILLFVFILGFSFGNTVTAQNYCNEWINYSQKYYKIKVVQDGVYRISYSTLASAGTPLQIFDPRQFQIFANGVEQYIYVKGENDGVFNQSDYIEFYGKRNRGELDAGVYFDPSDMPNPDYSLFNDTAIYYLTWNSSITNRRLNPETDKNFVGYTGQTFIWYNSRVNYTLRYFNGKTDVNGITDSRYTKCEGWFDSGFDINSALSYSRSVPTPAVYSSGPNAEIEMLIVGASDFANANPDHHIIIDFAGQTVDTIYEGYTPIKIFSNRPANTITSGNTLFNFNLPNDLGSGADFSTLSYINIRYPRLLNLNSTGSLLFEADDALGTKTLFNFSGLNAPTTDTVIVYDLTNNKRILTQRSGPAVSFLVPNSGNTKQLFLVSESNVFNVQSMQAVNSGANSGYFINYADASFFGVDYLIVTHKSLLAKANEYASYRALTGYTPVVADVDLLYDEFAYGINKHPLAITNFARFASTFFADTIHGLFLIGKGYRAGDTPYNYRKSTLYNGLTLVPSFGNPPSDNLFTSALADNNFAQTIPTGRLAARSPQAVGWYLQKVKDFEIEQNKPFNPADPYANQWMKRVLHFAGGSDYGQMMALLYFLNKYRDTLEAPYFGADVKTFSKSSTAPIQQNQSDSLRNLINDGVAILNFFGHAAGIGFDISIDNPQDYSNYKRYPFLIANSCFAGDLYQPTNSSSEEFVLIENKGTIGYLGSITKSLITSLDSYSTELIRRISRINYNKPIGFIVMETVKTLQSLPGSLYNRDVCLEMTLHCDPVLRIGGKSLPDLMLTTGCIYFNPSNVTNQLDSFTVNIIVNNVGMAITDSVVLELTRTFPDNTTEAYSKMIRCPLYSDTIPFRVPLNPLNSVGLNSFFAFVDAFDAVYESDETNNSTTATLLIVSNDVNPVYPYEYAVLPDTFITLVASTGYAMAPPATYLFQIDTTDSFNSPFMVESNPITQAGGIIEWELPFSMLSMPDSTVYYWRVRSTSNNNWRESSFQFIPNKRGWGQAHFFQFKKDNYNYVSYNKPLRIFEFINTIVNIQAQTGYYPYILWSEEWYKINNILKGQWSCTNYNGDGMKFAIFDTLSISPLANTDPDLDGLGPFDALNCRSYVYYDFDFYTNGEPWFSRMYNMIDSIPDGYYVLAFSHRNHNAQNWPDSLYEAFEKIGSNIIRTLPNNLPYIIFGRKGYYNMADERVGANINSIISGSWDINTSWKEGYIESTTIGPASEWGSLHWRVSSFEPGIWTDTVRLSVIGIKQDGTENIVISNLPPVQDSLDIYNLNARIDANIYPYLRLHLDMSDDSMRTPAQLDRWQVLYEPMPETAIDPNTYFTFYKDTLQEGEMVKLAIATRNIGPVDFPDSLAVAYWIIDNERNIHNIKWKKLRLHPVDDVLIDSISFSSAGFVGNNSLWVEFNPVDPQTGYYDQLEQHHFNNIAEIKFVVSKDLINPMLDVTFDGVHILDGDIVSAKPLIEIMLKDENKFLMLNDTSAFRIYLLKPGSQTMERVYFKQNGQDIMYFYPPSNNVNNTARVEFPAGVFSDGKYKLIVQARDKSGNESGDIDYTINFEVINKPAITDVLNWPNPFSTKTHFVFTLTGASVPDYFKIQIMTITGKVVREIDKAELGNIHIGRNVTEYAWDGRDEFGDQLANGVYLYRVIVKLDGQQMEKIETKAGQYFTKEFGKMMLMR